MQATGIRTNVLYFTSPNEEFPALVRRVTFTNEGKEAIEVRSHAHGPSRSASGSTQGPSR